MAGDEGHLGEVDGLSDTLFSVEEIPEVPIFRPPRRSRGESDARFRGEYPPEWTCCPRCEGTGQEWRVGLSYAEAVAVGRLDVPGRHVLEVMPGMEHLYRARDGGPCRECLGMGKLPARVRLEAGHRCVRCQHPYMPKGDAVMLSKLGVVGGPTGAPLGHGGVVRPSGLHPCERCGGSGEDPEAEQVEGGSKYNCEDCGGSGERWLPWSTCDERCLHAGPIRWATFENGTGWAHTEESYETPGWAQGSMVQTTLAAVRPYERGAVEAFWRILTVHHADGDKANVRWWNLLSLCQRCHLHIQGKVVMERVWPHPHSPWFRPFVAGYYAAVYLDQPDLTREEVEARMDELLALELDPSYDT